MKLCQALTIAEEVQTLHERANALLNTYIFFLQPSLNYFRLSELQHFTHNSAINNINTFQNLNTCFS